MEIPTAPATQQETAVELAIKKSNVPAEMAESLRQFFEPLEKQANEWKAKADLIVVTDITEVDKMKEARTARLALRQIRLNIEKLHKEQKADILAKGQVLDLVKRTLTGFIEPIETQLQAAEDFIKIQEQKAKEKLQVDRLEKIVDAGGIRSEYELMPLHEMNESTFEMVVLGIKAKREQLEAEEKEKARIREENERNAQIERERVKEQNEKLKVYNDRAQSLSAMGFRWNVFSGCYEHAGINYALDKKAIEDAQDAVFDSLVDDLQLQVSQWNAAEKKRIDQQNKDLQDKRDADEKKRIDEINEKKAKAKERRAPDKIKLLAIIDKLKLIEIPVMREPETQEIADNVKTLIGKINTYITKQCDNL